MPRQAQEYRVLIASPSDVADERKAIPEVLTRWNRLFKDKRIRLSPVKWEDDSTPAWGDRPQAILNRQIVESSDILVAVFWTRLGTQTGDCASGTVEEIAQFVAADKPVLLYVSGREIPPDKIDLKQQEALKKFLEEYGKRGIYHTYADVDQLRDKLLDHLTVTLDEISLQPESKPEERGIIQPETAVHGVQELTAEETEILQLIGRLVNKGHSGCTEAQIRSDIGLSITLMHYCLENLETKNFIMRMWFDGRWVYSLLQAGRQYLIQNQLE